MRSVILAERRTPSRVLIIERVIRDRPDIPDYVPYRAKLVEYFRFDSEAEALTFARKHNVSWEVDNGRKTKKGSGSRTR